MPPNPNQPKPEPKPRTTFEKVTLGMMGLGVIACIVMVAGVALSNRNTTPPSPATRRVSSPTVVSCCDIEYRVTVPGSGRASITLTNAGGNTEQHTRFLPFSTEFRVPPGQFLYISAQSMDDVGQRITCEIVSNGKVIETATSTGRYVIATCSGSAR